VLARGEEDTAARPDLCGAKIKVAELAQAAVADDEPFALGRQKHLVSYAPCAERRRFDLFRRGCQSSFDTRP